MKTSKDIRLEEFFEARSGKGKFRLKVSYKEDNPEDEYRFDYKRAVEEAHSQQR